MCRQASRISEMGRDVNGSESSKTSQPNLLQVRVANRTYVKYML